MTDFAPPSGAWPGAPLIRLLALMIFVGMEVVAVTVFLLLRECGYCEFFDTTKVWFGLAC